MTKTTKKAKLISHLACAIALLWASWWIFFGLASGIIEGLSLLEVLRYGSLPGLIFLISAALAWQWKNIGGTILLLEGLLLLIFYPLQFSHLPPSTILLTLIILAFPPLLAAFLLLTSRQKFR